ncbi:hypothetical protein ACPESV_24560 [Streptomyces umbrinus]|uniref:hypothetical protein n=1 Tax=Streptomyces umbrinus TaxID=67370 RepID=UPI003C2B33EF
MTDSLRLAHQARRAKEHQLDDIRRALCDIGFMEDDDPYSHADLAEVIRQNRPARPDPIECVHEAALGQAEERLRRVREVADIWFTEGEPGPTRAAGKHLLRVLNEPGPAATEATAPDCSRTTPNNSAEQPAGPTDLPS